VVTITCTTKHVCLSLVGQERICTLYRTVYLMKSQQKLLLTSYMHGSGQPYAFNTCYVGLARNTYIYIYWCIYIGIFWQENYQIHDHVRRI
jgi:hypothetical protein